MSALGKLETTIGLLKVSTRRMREPLRDYGNPNPDAVLWYETIIVGGKKDGKTRRSANIEQALQRHSEMCEYANKLIKQ
jgi:hypothetical protein